MDPGSSNNASNAANGNENSYGGRARIYAEPSHVKAPPQTRMVSRFKKPQPPVQRFTRTEPTIASTLPQHRNVQMSPILRTCKSAHNPTLNRMLERIAAKHTESVQRAMEEEQANKEVEAAPQEQVQMSCGAGCGEGGSNPDPSDTKNSENGPAEAIAPRVQMQEAAEEAQPSVARAVADDQV